MRMHDEHGYTYEWVREEHFTQQGNFRTYGCSWIVEFILYIAIAGLVKHTNKYIIYQVQLRSEVTSSHQESGCGIPQGFKGFE